MDRLSEKIGTVGLLVCRSVRDPEKALKQCKSRYDDKGYVILLLSDEDLVSLVRIHAKRGEPGVSQFMRQKLRPLTFDTT